MQTAIGFTLIELTITIAVLSILILLAYPNYRNYLVKIKREKAEITLWQIASELERYHTLHNTYLNAQQSIQLPFLSKTSYQFTLSTQKNHYCIQAKPINKQALLDRACGKIELNEQGKQFITGTGNLDQCWR